MTNLPTSIHDLRRVATTSNANMVYITIRFAINIPTSPYESSTSALYGKRRTRRKKIEAKEKR